MVQDIRAEQALELPNRARCSQTCNKFPPSAACPIILDMNQHAIRSQTPIILQTPIITPSRNVITQYPCTSAQTCPHSPLTALLHRGKLVQDAILIVDQSVGASNHDMLSRCLLWDHVTKPVGFQTKTSAVATTPRSSVSIASGSCRDED